MTKTRLIHEITQFDGFGGPSEDGKSISIEITNAEQWTVELRMPTDLAETIAAALSSLIGIARTIAPATGNGPSCPVGYGANDVKLYRNQLSGDCRLDFSAEGQPALTVFLPIHTIRKLGSAIDGLIFATARVN